MSHKIEQRANRISGYLNDLLEESFPEKAKKYEVIYQEVDKYVNSALGPLPVKVSYADKPTYEFRLKPRINQGSQVKVMILHKPDLSARIDGGKKNERKHYYINLFRNDLEKAILELESVVNNK